MKVESIRLTNFKRFKELTISGLPETAKLVLLVGENGCGKSSLFDALHSSARSHFFGFSSGASGYYGRNDLREDVRSLIWENVDVEFHGGLRLARDNAKKAIYVRSAHRNTPSFSHSALDKVGSALGEQRFERLIDNDQATDKNYLRLVSDAIEGVFETNNPNETFGEFRKSVLAEIGSALRKLFPGLEINSLGNPLKESTFKFTKGEVAGFKYENLSGGEKAAFDLILDLIVKRKEYDDTVFCIDEPETHINNRVQAKLLEILYSLVPDNCQLWLATHSIGMMRAAYKLQQGNPEEVVFLNFSDRDFDKPEKITPSEMTRELWERMHEIVLGDLVALVMPGVICLCEGESDEVCYTEIFKGKYPLARFVSVKGKGNLKNMGLALAFARFASRVIAVQDRDRMLDEEADRLRKDGINVLSRPCIESYLLDDEVLQAFCEKHFPSDPSSMLKSMREIRNEPRGNDKDRMQKIHHLANNSGYNQSFGEGREAFMKSILSPLITSDMKVYRELERDIFGGDDKKASR